MSWERYNPNPKGRNVGDCTVRALAKATHRTWEEVYAELTAYGFMLSDMPSANHVWGAYLRKMGFERYIVDDKGQDSYTVADFCRDNPVGTYVLAIQGHVVCAIDGTYYDSWDSGNNVPLYYWTRCKDGNCNVD